MLSCTLLFSFNLICNWVEMNKPLYLLYLLFPPLTIYWYPSGVFSPHNNGGVGIIRVTILQYSFFTVIERITLIYADNSLFFFALGQQQSPSILWLLLEDRFFMNSFLLWCDYRLDGVGASRKVGGRNTSGWSLYRGFAAKWRTPFWGV